MGGFFGITSTRDCMTDVFFGTDYHSHLGTRRGGMAAYDPQIGLQRTIHSIENAPFRTKFENIFREMKGTSVIGCISDSDPQPMLIRSNLGTYAICTVGIINNSKQLIDQYLSFSGGHFDAMTGGKVNSTELIAALIDQKSSFEEGIVFAQKQIEGTANVMILTEDGSIIAARDRLGRLPVSIGKREDGYAVSFEEFAYEKLGFTFEKELGPGEVVLMRPDSIKRLVAPGKKKRICAFLWSYYGYPTSNYEGINVEAMRYRNGAIMAASDRENGLAEDIDYVGGVPDSGTPHAIGYANESGKHFARAFIKYTPTWARSFMPPNQNERDKIAQMKQIPVKELIKDKNLLFVDDSIVRGTQLRETVEFLYDNGAKSVHMRSACPPIMYACKFLNFSRSNSEMELLGRRIIVELEGEEGLKYIDEYSDGTTERGRKLRQAIADKFHFSSLEFQSLEGVIKAIGLDPCELCTYCWNGKE
ncbi:MAG: amidophosphoribosyltransferase [Firmicutes bacterium]|nr:amidophosphoribosyltransferase [Bacillota bacterium]MBQ3578518.1 amidophosphoribosyltransferase [Bacillota bacterium]MBQ4234108.1 amidophosphoribosyltransferase [Bacillota bacterium]MBR0114669.1 amidophosphoribosyltransferase [Bacillota bacterium]